MTGAHEFEVIHEGRPGQCRHPTTRETDHIREELIKAHPDEWERLADLIPQDLMLMENYISDGPGFAGTLAVLFWGEPCFITVIGDNGSTGHNWEVIQLDNGGPYFCQSCSEGFEK
jgi:hypothetical protein